MRLMHGLEVHPASTADRPAYLCYTPDYAEYRGGKEYWFEGEHVGAVQHDLDTDTWCPVDTDWYPMDRTGEQIFTTLRKPEIEGEDRARFAKLSDAVMFLAALWNQRNPMHAVSIQAVAA